jgi:hypothetical protein
MTNNLLLQGSFPQKVIGEVSAKEVATTGGSWPMGRRYDSKTHDLLLVGLTLVHTRNMSGAQDPWSRPFRLTNP